MGTTTEDEDKGRFIKVPVTYDDGSTGHRLVPKRRFLNSLFTDDVKLFWVTFAATVAGTIASLMIVAVAVIIARVMTLGGLTVSMVFQLLGLAVAGVVIILVAAWLRRWAAEDGIRPREGAGFLLRFGGAYMVGSGGLITVLALLTLLGLAVGVK